MESINPANAELNTTLESAQDIASISNPEVKPGMPAWAKSAGSFVISILLAMLCFAAILLLMGKNPIEIYVQIFQGTLGTPYGWSEIVVKMIPFILCALAVAIPARLGLGTVGGEGQIYIGAIFAGFTALKLGDALPPIEFIPVMIVPGRVRRALLGGVCAGFLHFAPPN